MSGRCLKTATIPARESQCVLAEEHKGACVGEGDQKRHHVLKADPGEVLSTGMPLGGGKKPPGARFMVRLGGDKSVPVITPEEVLNESLKTFERDRLLATAMVAEDRVLNQAPPRPAETVRRMVLEEVEKRTSEILDEHARVKKQLELAASLLEQHASFRQIVMQGFLTLRTITKDEQGRRVATWPPLTPELVAVGEALWPIDLVFKPDALTAEELESLRAIAAQPRQIKADVEPFLRLWFAWQGDAPTEGRVTVMAITDVDARLAASKALEMPIDEIDVAPVTEQDIDTMQELIEEGASAKRLLEAGYGMMPLNEKMRTEWVRRVSELLFPKAPALEPS